MDDQSFAAHLQHYAVNVYSCDMQTPLHVWQTCLQSADVSRIRVNAERLAVRPLKPPGKKSKRQQLDQRLHDLIKNMSQLVLQTPDDIRRVIALLEIGSDWRAYSTDKGQFSRNCLHISCRHGLAATILGFIMHCRASFTDFCTTLDDLEISPLAYAVMSNHTVIVHTILALYFYDDTLDKKAVLEKALTTIDNYKRTPLHYAAINRNEVVFLKLFRLCPAALLISDAFGFTPVSYLATSWCGARTIILELLNDAGTNAADLFQRNDADGGSLLTWFAQDAPFLTTKLLLEKGVFAVTPESYAEQLLVKPSLLPLENAFSSGAEINFFALLNHTTGNLFSTIAIKDLTNQVFLGAPSEASCRMRKLLTQLMASSEQFDFLTKEQLPNWLRWDVACQLERAVLLYDEFTPLMFHAATEDIKKSILYTTAMRYSKRASAKIASDVTHNALLMRKYSCECETYSNPCTYHLNASIDPDHSIPYAVCPCLSRGLKRRAAETPLQLAPYKWLKQDGDGGDHAGHFIHIITDGACAADVAALDLPSEGASAAVDDGLRLLPSAKRMAFLYSCNDECACHYDRCPNVVPFEPSRCFFEIFSPPIVIDVDVDDDVVDMKPETRMLPRYALRTRERIKQGQFVGNFIGNVSTYDDIVDHLTRMPDDIQYMHKLPIPLGGALLAQADPAEFELYLNQAQHCNFTRFIRHACCPNLEIHLILPRGSYDLRMRVMCLFALRDIDAKEELTVDRGVWWLENSRIACKCQSPGCVGERYVKREE